MYTNLNLFTHIYSIQTQKFFPEKKVLPGQITDFENIFESYNLKKMIDDPNDITIIQTGGSGEKISDNLKYALIASGLSDEEINPSYHYTVNQIKGTQKMKALLKQEEYSRILSYLNQKNQAVLEYIFAHQESDVNMCEMTQMMISYHNLEQLGEIPDETKRDFSLIQKIREEQMPTSSVATRIYFEIKDGTFQKEYIDYATSQLLSTMALVDFYLYQQQRDDGKITNPWNNSYEKQTIYNKAHAQMINIKSSKTTNKILDLYDDFYESIQEYHKTHNM